MRVLVVDDDAISRIALVDALGAMPDLGVTEADSGEAAWQLLLGGFYPVVCCCDVRMPGMSGIELFRRMREEPRTAKVPMLMVTSASDRETVTEAIKLGASGFIIKPFNTADVRKKVQSVVGVNRENLFESTAAVLDRLSIPAPRYVTYLQAHAEKIETVVAALKLSSGMDKKSLEPLRSGCLVLGATYCADAIKAAVQLGAQESVSQACLQGLAGLPGLLRKRAEFVQTAK
jgi:two-component system chemotaxis response regulator CheY